ncbi:MAG TPA: helix-turn-helix transcriptional regulator [Candidatus Limnocylindrales bacterium]|nr:helix-turn-helix transcriptional regulator [Candidatus Limnocylindrales bacterium]
MDTVAFGRGFRALRLRKRLRQDDLAAAAGVSRGAIARIEQGHADKVTIETLEQVAKPLGARVVCRLSWNGEYLDRLLDADHAAIVEQVVRFLAAAGWLVATEVSFNVWGERGSIDVLAFRPDTRILLVIEVKSVVPDVQATLVTLDRKERLAPEIARERGWDAVAVARLLVIRESRTTRRRIEEHTATFGNAFPDRARTIRTWLARPEAGRPLRGLWFLSNESQAVAMQRVRRRPRLPERGPEPGP